MSCKLQSASNEIMAPEEIINEPQAQGPWPALSLPLPPQPPQSRQLWEACAEGKGDGRTPVDRLGASCAETPRLGAGSSRKPCRSQLGYLHNSSSVLAHSAKGTQNVSL